MVFDIAFMFIKTKTQNVGDRDFQPYDKAKTSTTR